jgi:DNA-binding phage protein
MKKAVHKTKGLTAAESRRMKSLQAQLEAEKEDIVAYGRELLDAHQSMISTILADLRLAKETQQLSLNDLQNRTGMDRAQLSRLFSESAAAANPTIQTLERVAAAFGKRVVLSLQDV